MTFIDKFKRIKRIIRDMQIQKIKSFDLDNDLGSSALVKKNSRQFSQKDSRVDEKQSLSFMENMPTQKRFWGKMRNDQAGRIIKNNVEPVKTDISPRRRSQLIKFYGKKRAELF